MEKIITRGTALNSLGFFNFHGPSNVENGYTFPDGETPPTEEIIQAEIIKLQVEYDAQEYARNRQAEYPDWGTQLEKIDDDGLTRWREEMIDPIKSKWPKDNSGPK